MSVSKRYITVMYMENVSTLWDPTTALAFLAIQGMDSLITAVSVYTLCIMLNAYLHSPNLCLLLMKHVMMER